MKLILAAALLLVAHASVTTAQVAYECVAPPVWYSHFMEINPSRREERKGHFYYDADNLHYAIREEIMEGFNNLSYYWEIFDYKANMGYRIVNETLKECQRFTLMGEFPRMGPFLQDQFRGEYVIGSDMKPKDGVKVLVYSGYSGQGEVYGVWIPAPDYVCIPVSETYTDSTNKIFHSRRYYDIRVEIFDFSVFEPPSYC